MKTKIHDFAFQVKAVKDDGTFEGYGSVFNNQDFGGDIVAPGAFTRTLAEMKLANRQLPMLWQHDTTQPIGFYPVLKEDDYGLFVQGQLLLDVQKGAEAYSMLKAGVITGMSIGYATKSYEIDNGDDDWTRTLTDVELYELSLVTFPMNDAARVNSVKHKLEAGKLPTLKEFERFLRDAGLSKSHSTAIASRGLKTLLRSESADGEAKEIAELLQNFTLTHNEEHHDRQGKRN